MFKQRTSSQGVLAKWTSSAAATSGADARGEAVRQEAAAVVLQAGVLGTEARAQAFALPISTAAARPGVGTVGDGAVGRAKVLDCSSHNRRRVSACLRVYSVVVGV